MPTSNKTEQGLRLVSFCPVCEIRSKSMRANTLASQGDTKLMHIQCHKCQNTFLALVSVNQVGASSVGLLTDLTHEDVLRFRAHQDVSVNDVIAIHERLSENTFHAFFAQKKGVFVKKAKVRSVKKLRK